MRVLSISFTGGKLDGQTVSLSDYMTNLIGIRGAGKSSILETVRYALDIPYGNHSRDRQYKDALVQSMLGSGGKATVNLADEDSGAHYIVERICGEEPVVYRDGLKLDKVRPAAILSALYFGQKDLSDIGADGFGQDLLEKFFGANLVTLREEMDALGDTIGTTVGRLRTVGQILSRKEELEHERADLSEKLRLFRDLRIDEKLQAQVDFQRDREFVEGLRHEQGRFFQGLEDHLKSYDEQTQRAEHYLLNAERPEFDAVKRAMHEVRSTCGYIKSGLSDARKALDPLDAAAVAMQAQEARMTEEFARIRRDIQADTLNPDDFVRFQTRLDEIERSLAVMEQTAHEQAELGYTLQDALERLGKLRHAEYDALAAEVDALNARKLSISILLGYRDDKERFYRFLEGLCNGANIQKAHLRSLAKVYNDPIEIYADLVADEPDSEKELSVATILKGGSQLDRFRERIMTRLADFLGYQVPNTFTLLYKGRELKGHSIGQRASALIMFLLSKGDSELLLIDQPEDDLDNVTIYEDVVQELKTMRGKTQFVFATHNPNIPVLGDCDQVIRCEFRDEHIELLSGPVSDKELRHEILAIMEGGKDAFDRRRKTYSTWNFGGLV